MGTGKVTVEGLLWYDRKDDTLTDKIARATARYQEKQGRPPNVCFINPANAEDREIPCTVSVNGTSIKVTTKPNVLLHHYWIGEQEQDGNLDGGH